MPVSTSAQTADCNWAKRTKTGDQGVVPGSVVKVACPVITIPIPGASAPFQTPAECPTDKTVRSSEHYLCDTGPIPGTHCKVRGELVTVTTYQNASPCPQFNLLLPEDRTSLAAWRAFLEDFLDQMSGLGFCGELAPVSETHHWSAFHGPCAENPADQSSVDPGGPEEGDLAGWSGVDEYMIVSSFEGLVPGANPPSEYLTIFSSKYLADDSLPASLAEAKLAPADQVVGIVAKYKRTWPTLAAAAVCPEFTITGGMTAAGAFDLRAAYKAMAEGESVVRTRIATFDGATFVSGYTQSSMLSVHAASSALRDSTLRESAPFARMLWRWVTNPTRIGAVQDADYVESNDDSTTLVVVSSPRLSGSEDRPTVEYKIEEQGTSQVLTEVLLRNAQGAIVRKLELGGYTSFGKLRRPSTMEETVYGPGGEVLVVESLEMLSGSESSEAFEIVWPKPDFEPKFYGLRLGDQ